MVVYLIFVCFIFLLLSPYVDYAGFKLLIALSQPSECWASAFLDYLCDSKGWHD